MNCSELDQMLCPYLDGEFGADERRELEGHLSQCPACAAKVHRESFFRAGFRARAQAAAAAPVPQALRDRIHAALRAEDRRRVAHRVLPYAAAAAVVAIAGGSFVALQPPRERSFLDDAAARHAKNLPVEVTVGAPEDVEAWFGGKLDHRVHVPRLNNARVAGARLSNVKDREAAYITYEVEPASGGARRVGVFVFPDSEHELEAQPLEEVRILRTHRGYNVAIWREDEIVYPLVTDLDEDAIRRLLQAQGRDAAYGLTPPPAPSLPIQNVGLRQ